MIFACKYTEPLFFVQTDETEWVQLRPGAAPIPRETKQQITIEFKQGIGVPFGARIGALRHFSGNGQLARMAFPERDDGILGTQAYEGFEPERAFSFYDTEKMAPPEHKELIEQFLLQKCKGPHVWLYEPEKLKAPWPAYDQLTTAQGVTHAMVAERIAAKVKEDGYSPVDVIAYERENRNREQVVRALEALIAEDIAKRAEDAALTVEV